VIIKIPVLWDVTSCSLVHNTNIWEHPAASIFRSEDLGHRFVQNAYIFAPGLRVSPNLQISRR
jgi:hypothetical protein